MKKKINRIAVFTSGGDAPGMNAAVRAVVRNATFHDLHIYGIYRGYQGMIEGDIKRLETGDVGNIMHRGGTTLKTARSKEFHTEEGRRKAYDALLAHDIDACIAIGGDGTFMGARIFQEEFDIPMIGVPGTIDNDIYGSDYTIGFDTAVNTAVEAVDRIRDTADSHNRLFFIEVMGRHSGFIALKTAIASGAASVMIPEKEVEGAIDSLVKHLRRSTHRRKLFNLVIVAEGDETGGATKVAEQVKEQFKELETKVTIIGHLQRGGSPTASDRILATRLGYAAVEALLSGKRDVMVGIINDKLVHTPLEETIGNEKVPGDDLIRMAQILAL